jgi:hypothetical protein
MSWSVSGRILRSWARVKELKEVEYTRHLPPGEVKIDWAKLFLDSW